MKKLFLIGNPNVGKSTVFSRLTGVDVISSNYPGTTIEVAKGQLIAEGETWEVIDLPGVYSLEAGTKAEEVALSLLRGTPKEEMVVLDIVDSTNLERNLYLTFQLLEAQFPVIICLNMHDDALHRGITIDEKALEMALGVVCVPTCAITGTGIKKLMGQLNHVKMAFREPAGHQGRWQSIGQAVSLSQTLAHRHHSLREHLEDASVRPFSGALIAVSVLIASFWVVRTIGEFLVNRVADPIFFSFYKPFLDKMSVILGPETLWHHLLLGDLVGGQIDFKQSLGLLTTAPYIEFAMVLPYIISFYFVLSLLEDVGFLPRLAMLLDGFLHRLGLHGFAIVPVLLGLGCNVPGILATRTLESRRERFIAATLISIGIPCVPLQAMIFGLLGQFSGFYVTGVYLVLFALWLILGLILNQRVKGYSPELLVEIPCYRIPDLRALMQKLFLRIKGFIVEAMPVVLAGVFIVNAMLYFHWFDVMTSLFSPLMNKLFGLPKEAAVALIVGFFRKDVAVGLLLPLGLSAKQFFIATVLLAISFPCIATFVILLRELGIKDFIKSVLIMLLTGLIVGVLLNLAIVSV
ncbi:MAG: ferrous iron transporter B [Candidatus Omnitrophota bacterium]